MRAMMRLNILLGSRTRWVAVISDAVTSSTACWLIQVQYMYHQVVTASQALGALEAVPSPVDVRGVISKTVTSPLFMLASACIAVSHVEGWSVVER